MAIYIGTAGWSLRKDHADEFPSDGTHLERYAQRLNCVEINSSFYRPHRVSTYQRWAASTPPEFRFAVKLPKQITHVQRLVDPEAQIDKFLDETSGLGEKRGPVLVQLPPSLEFDALVAERFFQAVRLRTDARVVCEPRHPSWFNVEAASLLTRYSIDRVAADPAVVVEASSPGGAGRTAYFRWHGSPRVYYSKYDELALRNLAARLASATQKATDVWCIFDNTALGAATGNALVLVEMLRGRSFVTHE
ncbi:MAG TPA: DUF72 domain-containing protein [Pirellulales bacterium]|jgi:uncharacterized protein YecE (DUF72 family)|nr:DUF72 domain-containing protein [Pirellulales bacterium]